MVLFIFISFRSDNKNFTLYLHTFIYSYIHNISYFFACKVYHIDGKFSKIKFKYLTNEFDLCDNWQVYS